MRDFTFSSRLFRAFWALHSENFLFGRIFYLKFLERMHEENQTFFEFWKNFEKFII